MSPKIKVSWTIPQPIIDALAAAGYDSARVADLSYVQSTKVEYAGEDYDRFFEHSHPGDSRIVELPPRIDFGYWVGDRIVQRSIPAPDTPTF